VTEGAVIPFTVSTATAPGGVEWATIAASIQADLAQIGINLEIQQMQQSELLTKYRAQELPMLLMNWGPDLHRTPTPTARLSPTTRRSRWPGATVGTTRTAIDLSKPRRRRTRPGRARRTLRRAGRLRAEQRPLRHALPADARLRRAQRHVQGFIYDPGDTPSISFWLISRQ
jgi:peptide/nickel transport system substrate-binding protein